MEFKGDEIFMTEKGIYEYTGVVHDDKKVYGRLANTDKGEECFKFSEVLSVWREVNKSDCNCFIPDVVQQSEQFKAIVFKMANMLALADKGNESVQMHRIHNSL